MARRLTLVLFMAALSVTASAATIEDALRAMADGNAAKAASILTDLSEAGESVARDALLLKARALLLAGEYEPAARVYQAVLKHETKPPFASKAKFGLAECRAAQGKFEEAERLYAEALASLTSTAWRDELARRFTRLAEEKQKPQGEKPADWAQSEALFRTALVVSPGEDLAEEIEFQMGRCLVKQKRFQEAAETLISLIERRPNSGRLAEIETLAARALWKAGDPVGARRVIRDLLEDYPQSAYAPQAAFLLSRTYGMPSPKSETLALGQEALRDYIRRFPKDRKVEQARLEVAMAPLSLGRHIEAEDALREYLRAGGPEAQLATARYNLGVCLAAQRRYAEAAEAWRDYLKLHPAHAFWSEARQGIEDMAWQEADQAFQEKKWKDAAEHFQAFADNHPAAARAPQAMLHAALARVELNEVDRALEILGVLTAKFPKSPFGHDGWFETAVLLEEKKLDFAKAREAYKKSQLGTHAAEAAGRLESLDHSHLFIEAVKQFTLGDKAKLIWHVRNVESVTIRSFKLQAEDFFRDRLSMEQLTRVDIALCTPDRTWTVPVSGYRKFAPIKQEVPLPFDRPGLYLLNLSAGKLEATTAVLVTDLAVILKAAPGEVFAFAEDRRQLKPLAGARLLFANDSQVLFEGKSEADGSFTHPLDASNAGQNLKVFAVRGDDLAWATTEPTAEAGTEAITPRAFLFSDRPAYRPGDTVHLAGIVRDALRESPGFTPGAQFDLTVHAPGGAAVWEGKTKLDEFGVFHQAFALDPAAPPGRYSFVLSRKDATFSQSFEVSAFRRLPFQLSVSFDHPVVFRGEALSGVIQVRQQQGSPAAGQRVQYRLDEPITYRRCSRNEQNVPACASSGKGTAKWQEALSDAQGQVRFSFPTRGFEETQKVQLQLRLPSHSQVAEAAALVAVAEYRASLEVKQENLFAGQPFDVTVKVTGPDGKPRGASLALEALGLREGGGELRLLKKDLTVPESGEWREKVTAPNAGNCTLRVLGWDRGHHPIAAELTVAVLGKDDPGIFLDVDRSELTVGSQAKVTLHSRLDRTLVLLTYETDKILGHRAVEVKKGDNALQIPITDSLAPNFQLAAAAIGGDQLYQAARSLTVSRALTVKLRLDQDRYAPGEEATLTVVASDADGRPVDARLLVSVVDAALLQVFPENLPDLLQTFYTDRPEGQVKTTASAAEGFPETEAEEVNQAEVQETEGSAAMAALSVKRRAVTEKGGAIFGAMVGDTGGVGGLGLRGVGSGGGGAGYGSAAGRISVAPGVASVMGGAERWLRQYFQETAAFIHDVRTGPDGVASVSFRLPDTITTWKVTARAVTRDTQLGDARMDLVASRPFWVDLVLPPELEEGDSVRPMARAFNETPVARTVTAELEVAGKKESHSAKVAAFQTVDLAFSPIEVPAAASGQAVSLLLSAKAGDEQDNLKRTVPVRPRGVREEVSVSGRLENTIHRTLELDPALTDLQLRLLLSPRLERFLIGRGFDPLLFSDRPEQALMALHLLTLIGKNADPAMKALMQDRLRRALTHLVAVQRPDGSFGLSRGSAVSSLMATASAVRALALARPLAGSLGWTFPQPQFDQALHFLNENLPRLGGDDWLQRAAVLLALSQAGKDLVPEVQLHRLHRLRSEMPLGAQALLGLTWLNLGRPEQAAEIVATLRPALHFGSFGTLSLPWRMQHAGTGPVDQLHALELLASTVPSDPLVAAGSAWLWERGSWGGWWVPAEAEAAYAALAQLTKAEGKGASLRVHVRVNGQDAASADLKPDAEDTVLDLKTGLLKTGKNTLELSLEGGGSGLFLATLSGYRREAPPVPKDAPVKVVRQVEPVPALYRGHEIASGFSALQLGSRTWANEVSAIPAGRRLLVTLKIDRSFEGTLEHCVLEDRIPPGFELVDGSLEGGEANLLREGRRLAFFLPAAGRGQRIRYQLEALHPGSYQFPPAQLISLLDPATRALGGAAAMAVQEAEAAPPKVKPTPDELYALGQAAEQEKDYPLVIQALEQLNEIPTPQEAVANQSLSMLLFSSVELADHPRVLKYFELVKEKNPGLVIPFDKIEPIQAAYRALKAYEGGLHLDRGTADARFLAEMRGVGSLESYGEVAEALALFRDLAEAYPDSAIAAKARYAFSQVIYGRADRVADGETVEGFDRMGLIDEVIASMSGFLARFPTDPEAPAAVFSLASALLERNQAERSVAWSEVGMRRHKDSDMAPAIAYLKAFAHFKLGQYGLSLELCRQVAENSTQEENRDMATYIMAQIHHARGEIDRALELYRKVEGRFRDAAETIEELQREHFEIPEVVMVPPSKNPALTMKLKNVARVDLRAYRVDLMKLYLLKGSLDELNEINLAGIKPILSKTLTYDARRPSALRDVEVPLALPGKGAYLVLTRAGATLSHSLVLVGGLATEVNEDSGEGRVRVTVRDEHGRPIPGARVQLKGSDTGHFVAGDTDLRGIFLASDIQGPVTAIASYQGAYGLYRQAGGPKGVQPRHPVPKVNAEKKERGRDQIDFDEELIEGQSNSLKNADKAAGKTFFQKALEVNGMSAEQAK